MLRNSTQSVMSTWLVIGGFTLAGVLMLRYVVADDDDGNSKVLKGPVDIDPRELRIGAQIEMEHTTSRARARKIALDHLREDPRYYTKLCRWHQDRACTQS